MPATRKRWSDQRVEEVISNLLRIGVGSAAGVVLIGGLLYLLQFGAGQPQYQHFHGEPLKLHTFSGIFSAMLAVDSRAIIQFGLLLLILTPIARVVFSVFAFSLQHDRLYVLITLVVLAVLLINLIWG